MALFSLFRWAIICMVTVTGFSSSVAALNWNDHTSYRAAHLDVPISGKDGFTEILPSATGIDFVNRLAQSTSITNQIYLNGSGVAIADIDGDDLDDLYFCGLESDNQLYRNLGNFRFEAVSDQPEIRCSDQASTGALFADVDGDGDSDLLVNGIRSGTRLFLNDGEGKFREETDAWGLRNQRGSTSMTMADVNGDGWLDLYVVNYRNATMRDEPDSPFDVKIKDGQYELVTYRGRPGNSPDLVGRFSFDRQAGVMENGEADRLFLNTGGGSFQAVDWDEGIFIDSDRKAMSPPYDWGLSAMFRDLNGDGWPDLYVCNDFQSPDRVWINDGTGSFRPIRESAIRQTSLFSMGLDVADINRDGHFDLFVADMLSPEHLDRHVQVMDGMAFAQYRSTATPRPQSPRNTLLLNQGDGDFSEIARLAGIDASYWSWCPVFLDVDLDGYEDLLVTTGHGRDAQNADISREVDHLIKSQSLSPSKQLATRERFPLLQPPNVAFRNGGNLRFEEKSQDWGFDSTRITHGMVLVDLDQDGDQDLVATCLNDPPLILRNDSIKPRLRIRLRGSEPNSMGIGAKITVTSPGLPEQIQEIVSGGRYLSSDEPSRVFAMSQKSDLATIHVRWPDGTSTKVSDIPANQLVEVRPDPDFAVDEESFVNQTNSKKTLFKDHSQEIPHRHIDQSYDDYSVQSTLQRKQSEMGPGVTWFDFNGDGWEDLFIGAGRGGKMGVFRNAKNGKFIRQKAQAFSKAVRREQTTLLAWEPNSKDRVLIIGQSNYEDPQPQTPALWHFSVVSGKSNETLLKSDGSMGPLVMADSDGDGDLDLFVGGNLLHGKYPHSPASSFLRNQDGTLEIDERRSGLPENLGMIRAALFTNLDADHYPELVVAGDWMPIRIFKNRRGHYEEWDPSIRWPDHSKYSVTLKRLSDLKGLWNSLKAADFDGDGNLDLVAGNWGRNISAQPASLGRRRLYFEETSNRATRLIEAYDRSSQEEWMPIRDWGSLGGAFPILQTKFSGFREFGQSTMEEIIARTTLKMNHKLLKLTDSIVLLNRGDHFQVHLLPIEAQFAPVFGLGIGDFDSDGKLDAVLNQNCFSTTSIGGRQDAGGLLLLKGDGVGDFKSLTPSESGLKAFGQGRGLALCDFNHDGRLDFVSSQNGGPTKTYLNQSDRSGIRVRLRGNSGNRQAIGSRVRLVYSEKRFGPRQEIGLGAGFWSQDSGTLILGYDDIPEAIEILWPTGATETIPLNGIQKEIYRQIPTD
ncbi:CRTAC1 family protein [bacterium]|jgi:enediyne biosynthesis protein E4|nr:CRTAC1 family protein [bacterium]MDA7866543.1 CRTAC1 family protein [Verrucomicrobiota bacterium]